MVVHKSWVVNIISTTFIAITCVEGDKRLQSTTAPLTKAIIDNATHGLIGLLSAFIVLADHYDKLHLAAACMAISSMIDADHFIAARSLKLSDATNLVSRPFLHNSSIPVVLIVLLIYCHLTTRSPNLILWLIIVIVAFVTHHLRDANRRGLWFALCGSTPAFNDPTYILLILTTPYLIKCVVPETIVYTRVKNSILDV